MACTFTTYTPGVKTDPLKFRSFIILLHQVRFWDIPLEIIINIQPILPTFHALKLNTIDTHKWPADLLEKGAKN